MRHLLKSLVAPRFVPVRACFGGFHVTKVHYLVILGNKKLIPKRLFYEVCDRTVAIVAGEGPAPLPPPSATRPQSEEYVIRNRRGCSERSAIRRGF